MGALYLHPLDQQMAQTGLFYARFMDDGVILAPTRWKLRPAIKRVHQTLTHLQLVTHPDKTFIGRIERGFDFLGYAFSPHGVTLAPHTWDRLGKRLTRLYEHGADPVSLGRYVRQWTQWARAGDLCA